ncbi:MAG: DUF2281 domain-containing protein [Nostoc sp.]|uniref:DUF2281 domain-containing protein n=1 Tax=Nostoc sp. TaxID=1180 RepID=UPI002FF53ACD
MTIRETAIAKLQQLPEPLLQEINDFIDFILHEHQPSTVNPQPETNLSGEWAEWFEVVDGLEVSPTEPISEYQQRLLTKYRQQGLNL